MLGESQKGEQLLWKLHNINESIYIIYKYNYIFVLIFIHSILFINLYILYNYIYK